jgi:hypothetical protein
MTEALSRFCGFLSGAFWALAFPLLEEPRSTVMLEFAICFALLSFIPVRKSGSAEEDDAVTPANNRAGLVIRDGRACVYDSWDDGRDDDFADVAATPF